MVLSRKLNESVTIGDEIKVTVVQTGREKVRLGVTAPKETPVHREEIRDKIAAKGGGASRVAKNASTPHACCGSLVLSLSDEQYKEWGYAVMLLASRNPSVSSESDLLVELCREWNHLRSERTKLLARIQRLENVLSRTIAAVESNNHEGPGLDVAQAVVTAREAMDAKARS